VRHHWLVGTALSVLTLIAGGTDGAPASGASRVHPGIGSTLKQWEQEVGIAEGPGQLCTDIDACFGPAVQNSEPDGRNGYEFTGVEAVDGLVNAYLEHFADHTTLAVVETRILQTLPPDTKMGPVHVVGPNHTCAVIDFHSPAVANEFKQSAKGGKPHGSIGKDIRVRADTTDPSGTVGVVLYRELSSLRLTYSSSDIQTAVVVDVSTSGC